MSRTWFDMPSAAREQLPQAPTRPDETSFISFIPARIAELRSDFRHVTI